MVRHVLRGLGVDLRKRPERRGLSEAYTMYPDI